MCTYNKFSTRHAGLRQHLNNLGSESKFVNQYLNIKPVHENFDSDPKLQGPSLIDKDTGLRQYDQDLTPLNSPRHVILAQARISCRSKHSGFTLIEMVVAISILGIIGTISALMINNTVEGYDALARRAKAQTSMRLAVDRMARELRHALPNSVCTYNGSNCSSSGDRFYFIKTVDGGEYQDQPGTYASGQAHAALPVTPASASSVDVINTNNLNASANQWLVVYSVDNSSIYSTTNKRKQIASITSKDVDGSAPANDIAVVNFTGSGNFPVHSPARRFHIIENNATLYYLSGTDLYRAQSAFSSPQTAASGTEQLLLQNVAALNFSYVAGSPQRAGLLRIDITLQQNAETLHLIHEAHVQNVP